MRLFVAINPDSAVHARIAEEQRRLRKVMVGLVGGIRWMSPEAVHLTLSFLGEVADPVPVQAALEQCCCPPMDLELRGLGVFSNARRSGVLWLGIADSSGALARLQADVATAMSVFVEPERRPFVPHLTLARMQPCPRSRIVSVLKSLPESPPVPWRIRGFSLMRSELDATGARYSVVQNLGNK